MQIKTQSGRLVNSDLARYIGIEAVFYKGGEQQYAVVARFSDDLELGAIRLYQGNEKDCELYLYNLTQVVADIEAESPNKIRRVVRKTRVHCVTS